jgi:ribosomal protein S1
VALGFDEWAEYRDRVAPTEDEWHEFVRQTAVGRVVQGVVVSHHRFGFFLDIGWGTRCLGLVEVPYMPDPGKRVAPSDYPAVGSIVERAIVLGHTPHNHQARLTIRPSDLANA